MNILVVDDERLLVKGLKRSLENDGFFVYTAYDGLEALKCLDSYQIDLIILDIMLPEIDGMTLCKTIRKKSAVPIIMLTARSADFDKLLGFEMGTDDYMTKPFNTMELIHRIRVIMRRINVPRENSILSCKELILNLDERVLNLKSKVIELTSKEFDILALLMKNRGKVYCREDIFEKVWREEAVDVRTIDVHVRNIREKIEDEPKNPIYIKTKWGIGYFFVKEGLNV